MAAVTKNSKTTKIAIFPRTARYIWLKICKKYKLDLDIDWYQNEKKKNVVELGHSGRLKIYVDPKKFYVNLGI